MRKEIKNKLMPILLMLSLLLSAVAIIPQVSADPFVFPDGVVSKAGALTCGDEVTYKVTDGSLTADGDYTLVIDATKFCELEEETADDDGNIEITFNVPGLENLGEDPIGTWTLELFDDTNTTVGAAYDYDITISNLYDIRIKYGGDWIDNLIYNTSYTPIYFYAYNWSGSKYEQCDFDLDFLLEQPDGTDIAEAFDIPDGIWDLDLTSDDLNFNNGDGAENLEYYCPLTIDGTTQAIPVLLDVTADVPDDSMWGETISDLDRLELLISVLFVMTIWNNYKKDKIVKEFRTYKKVLYSKNPFTDNEILETFDICMELVSRRNLEKAEDEEKRKKKEAEDKIKYRMYYI